MRTDPFLDGEKVIPGIRLEEAEDLRGQPFYVVKDGMVVDDRGCALHAMAESNQWFAPYQE